MTYESDAEGVAKVDANGVVTAVSEGTATITASTESQSGGIVTAKCVVHVLAAPDSIGFRSVSYTHLDVYKRQLQYTTLTRGMPCA